MQGKTAEGDLDVQASGLPGSEAVRAAPSQSPGPHLNWSLSATAPLTMVLAVAEKDQEKSQKAQ